MWSFVAILFALVSSLVLSLLLIAHWGASERGEETTRAFNGLTVAVFLAVILWSLIGLTLRTFGL